VFHGFSNKLAVLDRGFVLFWDWQFIQVSIGRCSWDEDVHCVGLGADNFSVETGSRQVDLNGRALVECNAWHALKDLDFDSGGVDSFDLRDGILEDNASLVATVNGNSVHLAVHLNDAVVALVDVDRLSGFGVVDFDGLVSVLEFDNPLVSLEFELGWRLLGCSLGGGGGGFLWLCIASRYDACGAQLGVLVGHL